MISLIRMNVFLVSQTLFQFCILLSRKRNTHINRKNLRIH